MKPLSTSVGAAAVVCLLLASSVSATKAPGTVALKVGVRGSGTVSVTGGHSFSCRADSCRHMFQVRRGRRIVVRAVPKRGWKLTRWTGACHGSAATCSLRLTTARSAAVRFVPPGARLNPYSLGSEVTLARGWKVRINSAIIDANSQVEAVMYQGQPANPTPRAGYQYTLVNATVTYVGSGTGDIADFAVHLETEGAHNTRYDIGCSPPSPDIESFGTASSGQGATANLCYGIASKDAGTLLLTGDYGAAAVGGAQVWFALR
jgi:Divergent InlB B-repeat domain